MKASSILSVLLEDAFASGDKRLVNHKQYYYLW